MTVLARIYAALAALAVVTSGLAWLLWHLAFSVEDGPPAEAFVVDLHRDAEISWGREGDVRIRAENEADAAAALGFAHGSRRAWSVTLWRQAALGRLSEWLGPAAAPADRLVRRLGLAERARGSLSELADGERRLLAAYAAGFNAALDTDGFRLRQEFLLTGRDPEPWLPLHTLAVERLIAWLAVTPPSPEEAARAGARAFFDDDLALRRLLHLHGFDGSIAWISNGTLFLRHVHGSGAESPFLEASVTLDSGPSWLGVSLPGTFFFPAGRSDRGAWAVLLSSTARLERAAWNADSAAVSFGRVETVGGETLVRRTLVGDRLVLSPGPDSVWAVDWSGLDAGTDLAAWRALPEGGPRPFRLFDGHGIFAAASGSPEILGMPPVGRATDTGAFAGLSPWSRHVAEHISRQDSVRIEEWLEGAYSVWAETTAPGLIRTLANAPEASEGYSDTLPVLRSWDFRFRGESIAASVFDAWIRAIERRGGGTEPDLLQAALKDAVDTLTARFGPDQSQWRWEWTHSYWRHFAVPRSGDPGMETRFAPVAWPGHGHASTLAWNASPDGRPLPAPAAWVGWFASDPAEGMQVRRRSLDTHAPLGRYLSAARGAATVAIPSPVISTTLLRAEE